MQTEIFINQGIHESRIAILESGRLAEIWIERPENERTVGGIYKGVVTAVLPGLQAAFVEIGHDRTAFLQVRDMMEADRGETDGGRNGHRSRQRGYPSIQNLIKKGEQVLVQVTKEPIGTKGARVTTQLSLPGRFMVLVPGGNRIGISRKITSRNERKRLKDLVFKIKPDGYSVIVRTEGQGQSDRDFKRDMKQLVRNHGRLIKASRKVEAPALVYKEIGMTFSVIRDLFTDSVKRLVVDSKELYKEITSYLRQVSPELRQRVEFYRDRRPIFDAFNIEEDIEKATDRTVWLRHGGALVIDYAEAGTFIDVNSARYLGSDDQEENNLNLNLRAAREIARQLKLRDIGGIIVIDFIDMNEEHNRKKVVDCLIGEFKRDRARVSVSSSISEFGLVEMTRQRVRPNLLHTHSEPCPICSGTGRIMGPDTTLTWIERWLQRSYAVTRERRYVLKVHPEVATYMLENREERLKSLRKATKARLQIETDSTLGPQDYRFFSTKRSLDVTAEFRV